LQIGLEQKIKTQNGGAEITTLTPPFLSFHRYFHQADCLLKA